MNEDDVYAELGEIVNGWKMGRESEDEVTVMDSTGLAALDVVAFNHAYEKALAQGVGSGVGALARLASAVTSTLTKCYTGIKPK